MTDHKYFPLVVDNTMREEFVRCEKAAYWNHERGLKPLEVSVDLHAGQAFAKGVEVSRRAFWEGGKSAYDSVVAGVEDLYAAYGNFIPPDRSAKTVDRMAGALTYYFEKFPLNDDDWRALPLDGKLGIEYPFSFPIDCEHPRTGQSLVYAGKPDMIALHNGTVWAVDENTGSNLSDAWALQWELNSQITGYCWAVPQILAANNIDLPFGGVVIRGTGINSKAYSSLTIECIRQEWEIQRWKQQVRRDIQRWADSSKYGDHNYALSHACAQYNSPCAYAKLCKAHDPEYMIESNYVERHWNPLEVK